MALPKPSVTTSTDTALHQSGCRWAGVTYFDGEVGV
jgi:hypothetical protein